MRSKGVRVGKTKGERVEIDYREHPYLKISIVVIANKIVCLYDSTMKYTSLLSAMRDSPPYSSVHGREMARAVPLRSQHSF